MATIIYEKTYNARMIVFYCDKHHSSYYHLTRDHNAQTTLHGDRRTTGFL